MQETSIFSILSHRYSNLSHAQHFTLLAFPSTYSQQCLSFETCQSKTHVTLAFYNV